MKKLLALLFLFVVIGIVYSQAPSLMKEKATSSKDTIKKEKTNLLPQTLIQDTIFDPNVKYVLYKKRTIYEVKQKFKREINEELLDEIIQNLEENNYLNDEIYIRKSHI